MDEVGESYGELGGQLPSADQRERGLQHVERLRQKLERADKPCPECAHPGRHHGPDGNCFYPVGPDRIDCPCGPAA